MGDDFPKLDKLKVGVFVGSHGLWTEREHAALDRFSRQFNCPVFCDHTSNFRGSNRVLYQLVSGQAAYRRAEDEFDVLIHIGEISGDYYTLRVLGKEVWRVSEDGELRDTFGRLKYVFEMSNAQFFERYMDQEVVPSASRGSLEECLRKKAIAESKVPEIPFSNLWAASRLASRVPENSTIHFGILNSLRAWNFFELPITVTSACNVGGFGIDGGLSSVIGASFADPQKLYFLVIGDLAFFYDMNALGNRHVGKNLRILLVNNGKGTEFRQFGQDFGPSADEFISAAGHFGRQSRELVRDYAQNLGFEYHSAATKSEFEVISDRFVHPEMTEKPMLFELFTDSAEESRALELLLTIDGKEGRGAKTLVKRLVGKKLLKRVKRLLGD